MQVIEKGKVRGIVLQDGEEIIVYSAKDSGGVSIKRIGDKHIYSHLNRNEIKYTYEEREGIYHQRAEKIKLQKRNWYLKNKQKVL